MLYRFLQANPAIRVVLPLILGVLLGNYLHFSAFVLLMVLAAICFTTLLLSVFTKRVVIASLIWLFFIVLGIFLVQNRKENYALPTNLSEHYVRAVVRAEAEEKERSMAVPLTVIALQEEQEFAATHFKTIVYFSKDSTLLEWNYGDTIVAQLQFFPLQNHGNPYAFNYSKLLKQRQIYCTAKGDVAKVEWKVAQEFSPLRYARLTQKRLTKLLDSYIPDKKASGFLQAMTLGDKTSLSPNVQVDFANAGVVHILAVSGLHVGILFLFINFILRPLRATPKGRLLLVCLGILLIWSFAFISGLSVSILRAAIMFSILQLSLLSLRPHRIYNAIGISAFVMLLINPFYLYEVGFQLSYLAVLSIVTFVPIWDKWTVRNVRADKVKKLLLVSLGAQLGVAPLVLYYFHHLPTYFLLGNLVVLVLAPFLLGGSLLILLSSPIPFLAKTLGIMVSELTRLCMFLVNTVALLPKATLLDYSLNFYQMLLLYLLLLTLLFYILKKKGHYFAVFLSCILAFISYTSWRNYQEEHQQMLVVHYVKNKSCYSLLSGKEALLLQREKLEKEDIDYNVKPLWQARGIKKQEIQLAGSSKTSIVYRNNHALIQNRHIVFCSEHLQNLKNPICIDVLVLNRQSNWRTAIQNYKIEQIVLDSSFPKWQSQKLSTELSALNFSVHDVNTDGAYVLD